MNREILFKARREEWRTLPEEKQWVEGDLLYSKEGTYISTSFITGGILSGRTRNGLPIHWKDRYRRKENF